MDMKLPYPAEATLRAEDYWNYLDEMEMTDAQKTALLEILWSIMATFVNMGFGADSVQLVVPAIVYAGMSDAEKTSMARQSFDEATTRKKKENGGGE